ncbi:uncharacterized protein LOC129754087 [Uranotaenia lowii]|uniref:uncharacterized protein LOC129754087 n=1 Tax=Uranotaenia lowii TaxID=190385 RepID=UPI0024784154|nr:uncharacterized protein LOC129754087 [Uranotaenia lowii]
MLRFVSALAILASTVKASPIEPAHYSYVATHQPYYQPQQHAYPEYYPVQAVESYHHQPEPHHYVAQLPQKQYIEVDAHELAGLGHYTGHSQGYSALYGGDNHGHLYHGGSYNGGYANKYNDYYAYPKYKFEYGVDDPHTGDHKKQWEFRDGDVVKGGYMLKEADGTTRVVEYTADDHNGFNAVVKKIGHAYHPEPHHAPQHYSQNNGYGYLGNYAGAYASGDYYGKGATSYTKVWKQH